MAEIITHYRVFIASPSGLEEERQAFKDAIYDYNDRDAMPRKVMFSPVGWELTLSRQGRPQELINKDIMRCDHFVLVLHTRWGSSPGGNFTSGTEEEFDLAKKLYMDDKYPLKSIAIFFKSVNEQMLADPGESLKKVLEFRKKIEDDKEFLYKRYDEVSVFKDSIYRHLSDWVREHENDGSIIITPPSNSGIICIGTDNIDIEKEMHDLIDSAEILATSNKIQDAETIFSGLVVKYDSAWPMARYGRFLREIGQRHRATEVLTKALERARMHKDTKSEAYIIRQLGQVREREGDVNGAIAQYNLAIDIYKSIDYRKGLARAYRDLSLAHRKLGDINRSLVLIAKSIDIYEDIGDLVGYAGAIGYQGVIQKAAGGISDALESHLKSLDINEKLGNKRGVAVAKSNIGIIHRMLGNVESALRHHQEVYQVFVELQDLQGQSRELSNIGTAYRVLGDSNTAIDYHRRALAIADNMQNKQGMAIQYANLGRDYFELGSLDESEDLHNQALYIHVGIDDSEGQAWQYEALGKIDIKRGDLDVAEKNLMKASKIFARNGVKSGQASVAHQLGLCYLLDGRRREAKSFMLAAVKIYDELRMCNERDKLLIEIDQSGFDTKI